MEHTKKFVLMDPRFVRPSMRDKALSGLDSIIADILNSGDSDDIKAKSYVTALSRFRNYSTPPTKAVKQETPPAAVQQPIIPPPPAATSRKRTKRIKALSKDANQNIVSWDQQPDSTVWERQTPKKSEWSDQSGSAKKKRKSRKNISWMQY